MTHLSFRTTRTVLFATGLLLITVAAPHANAQPLTECMTNFVAARECYQALLDGAGRDIDSKLCEKQGPTFTMVLVDFGDLGAGFLSSADSVKGAKSCFSDADDFPPGPTSCPGHSVPLSGRDYKLWKDYLSAKCAAEPTPTP